MSGMRKENMMSKEEMLKKIRECARKLGRLPTQRDLTEIGLTVARINRRCGTLGEAIRLAGLATVGNGYEIDTTKLLRDWARVVRRLGRVPVQTDYKVHGRYSLNPFYARYGRWQDVPANFVRLAPKHGLDKEFAEVMAIAARVKPRQRTNVAAPNASGAQNGAQQTGGKGKKSGGSNPAEGKTEKVWMTLPHSPLYGPRLMLPGLAHEPENENGVIHLFGMLGYQLGFTVLRIQSEFPDCEALRRVRNGRWQRVRIEFEYESRNFIKHRHAIKGCDMIVCWRNNWEECPVEVLELKEALSNWQSANSKNKGR